MWEVGFKNKLAKCNLRGCGVLLFRVVSKSEVEQGACPSFLTASGEVANVVSR